LSSNLTSMSSKIVPSLNSGLGDMQVSRNPRAGINPSGDFCMQIVPPVMIIRTLASGSAVWRDGDLNSPILGRFGLPAGSKRSNELGTARRSRAVGNECQGTSEQRAALSFLLRFANFQIPKEEWIRGWYPSHSKTLQRERCDAN